MPAQTMQVSNRVSLLALFFSLVVSRSVGYGRLAESPQPTEHQADGLINAPEEGGVDEVDRTEDIGDRSIEFIEHEEVWDLEDSEDKAEELGNSSLPSAQSLPPQGPFSTIDYSNVRSTKDKDPMNKEARFLQSVTLGGVVNSSPKSSLVTNYNGGKQSFGMMFSVKASTDLSLIAMDIHLDYSSYVTVVLYSKRGDFGGYEFSRASWFKVGSAYIRGRGLGSPTPLPQSIFGSEIEISPFEKRSFYIALDKPYLLSGGSRSSYGISAENPELAIYHGSGIGEEEFEYPIYLSRVWNGAIHYDTIEKETLPSGSGLTEAVASATDRLLWTTMTGGSGSYGMMFDVITNNAVIIKGMEIHAKSRQVTVTVFTKTGTHVGYNEDPFQWMMVFPPTLVMGKGKGRRTPLPTVDFLPITIPPGSTQAFYIMLSAPNLRYSYTSMNLGEVFVSNGDLNLLVGSGVGTKGFGGVFTPRVWNGAIHYALALDNNPPNIDDKISFATSKETTSTTKLPTYPPVKRGKIQFGRLEHNLKQFTTDFTGNSGSYGNMFDAMALWKDVRIKSMDIHVGKKGMVKVRIWYKIGSYLGYERNPSAWTELLPETDIFSEGYKVPTPIPHEKFNAITIPTGKTFAFYVTLTEKSLRYSVWNKTKKYVSDSSVVIYNGVGVGMYPFGPLFRNRLWNGILSYDLPASPRKRHHTRKADIPVEIDREDV